MAVEFVDIRKKIEDPEEDGPEYAYARQPKKAFENVWSGKGWELVPDEETPAATEEAKPADGEGEAKVLPTGADATPTGQQRAGAGGDVANPAAQVKPESSKPE